jgi:hypothetical protein
MMKLLYISCVYGVVCAGILHVLALFDIVLGNDLPLQILAPLLFLNVGIAIFRGIKRHPEGLELTTLLLPRRRRLSYFTMIAYGFIFALITSMGRGDVDHVFGDVLIAKDAALFYSLLLCFFSAALLLHDEFSIEDNGKH